VIFKLQAGNNISTVVRAVETISFDKVDIESSPQINEIKLRV